MHAKDQAARLRELVEGAHSTASSVRVIAVTSGKGGTGKSVLSVNLAIAFRRMGKRVLLIDADFGLANVDLMLGISSSKTLADVLSGRLAPTDAIQEAVEGVRFLSGGSGVEELIAMDAQAVGSLISRLLQLEGDTDIILVDTGAGVNPVVLRLIQAVSEAVIVTTPEPTAVMDAYALIKILSMAEQRPALRLVVNRVVTRREATETPEAIISLARKNMHMAIDLLGTVAADPLVPQTIKRQIPLLVAHPGVQASRDVQLIAGKLLGVAPSTEGAGLSMFFQRLLRPRAADR